jgi:hypothetical protein
MPRTIRIDGIDHRVATEKELLDFANAVRKAGGANVLEALLPSRVGNSEKCLIATALNFGCSIDAAGDGYSDGVWKWHMEFPDNMTNERIKEIVEQVPGARLARSPFAEKGEQRYAMLLPKHIGNAARAFDDGVAFEDYAI